jgi:hypothetical protein
MEAKIIEEYLNRINSVITSRIIEEDGKIKEVHIVSDLSRNPKQIARDVESVLVSQFDIHVDYKMISVAQVEGDAGILKASRFRLISVENISKGTLFTAVITLERDGELFEGSSTGIATTNNIMRLTCEATINAVENCCDRKNIFAIEDVTKISISGKETLLTYITALVGDQEILVCGSAINAKNGIESVVKSTLDAVNRIVARLLN